MRSTLAFALISAVSVFAQTALFVNTPASLVECQPAAITYGGGTAPYYLSVLPGGEVSAAALESFPSSSTTAAGSYTWTVDISAGTAVTLAIRDSTGALNYAQQVTIQSGTSTSCVTSSGAAASSGASSTTSAAAASSTSSAASSSASSTTTSAASSSSSAAATTTTSAAATTTSAAATTSTTSSAAAATTSSAKSGASTQALNALALVGAAVIALAA